MESVSKSGDIFEEALEAVATKTASHYRRALDQFLEHMGLDHEDLYEMHLANWKSDDPRDFYEVARKLRNYVRKRVEVEGLSTSHANQHVKAVKFFFRALNVPFDMNGNKGITVVSELKDSPSQDEVRRLVLAARHPRNLAVIMALKDSGLRVSDVVQLNVGDVDLSDEFCVIELRQHKDRGRTGGRHAYPCLGYEAVDAVKDWLRWRREHEGEYGLGDPLFTDIRGEGSLDNRMSGESVTQVVLRTAAIAGLQGVSAHSLRRFHTTQLTGAMAESFIALVQGRKIRDTRARYVRPKAEALLEAYRKAYPNLVVLFDPREEQRKMTEKMNAMIVDLQKSYNQDMREAHLQIKELREQVALLLRERKNK